MTADVIVVGAGNAALCAALAAREEGADVLVLERAPLSLRGGNSYFAGGVMRFPHQGASDLSASFPELQGGGSDDFDLLPYTENDFFDDMADTTEYRADPEMTASLVNQARATIEWLHVKGVRFAWSFGRHAFKVDGRFRFWGGASLAVTGGGAGLVEKLFDAAEVAGVRVAYGSRAIDLLGADSGRVDGVRVRNAAGQVVEMHANAVVLACGGFEANDEMRAKYLGPNWDLAKVRGTAFNTGDGITMALRFGAKPFGHWSGCHAVAMDANAPRSGDRRMGDEFSRHSYPLGIVVNKNCDRFLDEGADFHTHTYAKYGAEILRQPGLKAFQIFDSKGAKYLRSDYRGRHVSRVTADTIEELAKGLELDPVKLLRTVEAFNSAVDDSAPFDPNVKDGKSTRGIAPAKSNWATRVDEPPFLGFAVSTGITFTFGGLRVDEHARVLDTEEQPIPGLFGAGELVGGLFYHNYPSGTGLTSGAVFGRTAGLAAAQDRNGV